MFGGQSRLPLRQLSEPERKEIIRPDGEYFMCVDGRWIKDKDILAVVTVEQANVWTDCCGVTDETTT